MKFTSRVISIGERDSTIVKSIQIRLNILSPGLLIEDGVFGKKTRLAVRAFQSQHCNEQGTPLTIDGKVGLETLTSLFDLPIIPAVASTPLLDEVLRIAYKEIGQSENPPGSNKGVKVNAFLSSVGLLPGNAWCAAFVFWCFMMACLKLHLTLRVYKTGGCMQHWKKTCGMRILAKEAINDPTMVEPGDIFIINFGDGKGHCGLVTNVEGNLIYTIEGNTNNTGSSLGVMVCALKRRIDSINVGFIRYR
jgi:hypothetical protein